MTRLAFVVAASLALVPPQVVAQKAGKELRTFRRAFAADNETAKTLEAKRAALRGVRSFDSDRAVRALVDAYANLESEAEPLRERRRKFLVRGGGSKLLKTFRNEMQPIRNLQDQLLARLAKVRDPKATRAMVQVLLKSKRRVPLTLRLALASGAAGASKRELSQLVDSTSGVQGDDRTVLLLRALAPLGPRAAKAVPWMLSVLENATEQLRIEALLALRQMRSVDSIQPLIDHLESAQRRERDALIDTLITLTGAYPGETTSAWRMWHRNEGHALTSGEKPLGRGDPKVRAKNSDTAGKTSGSYFGIRQDGLSVLYVFDVSLSMKAKTGKKKDAVRPTRWERCKAELHRSLRELPPNRKFNLVGFANHLVVFEHEMVEAKPKNVERAHEWIDGLELEFETNVYDALEYSFQLAGRGVSDRYYVPEADTIFFLSDGAPTRPKRKGRGIERDAFDEVLAAVRRWNPLRRVVIHAVGLGTPKLTKKMQKEGREPPAREFLRRLAGENGGRFVEVR